VEGRLARYLVRVPRGPAHRGRACWGSRRRRRTGLQLLAPTTCPTHQPHHREPAANLADNLLRDYEQQWWSSVKKASQPASEPIERTCHHETRRAAMLPGYQPSRVPDPSPIPPS
jgi:hypothetical protein